ncbi:MAG: M20/M25/M40 family metallo-hydrolase [Candidatus Aminicenantaceae bacterium]
MKKSMILITALCLLVFSTLNAQEAKEEEKPDPLANFSLVEETQPVPEDVKVGFESITGKDAVTYLKFISDDLLEGRDTGSDGYDIAALYGATMFELWGLKPAGDKIRPRMDMRRMMMGGQTAESSKRSYFQNIAMRETLETDGIAVAEWQKGQQKKTRSFSPDIDYSYFASGSQSLTAPVVFVGYGIQEESLKFDEYKNLDVKGKFVMMISEAPGKGDPDSPFNKGELKTKYYPPRRRMRRMTNPKTKLATDLGALGVLLVENSPQDNPDAARQALDRQKIYDDQPIIPGERRRIALMESRGPRMPWDSVATIRISREMANQILDYVDQDVDTLKGKIEKTLQPQSMPLTGVTFTVKSTAKTKLVNSMNVLGYIEGSDPELKKEAIVIGGHLDHLGMRGDYIYNGADDDGSGSVGVMEIAEAFAKNPVKPKRSIVFALWTGEEKGLLGSRYYVAHPFIEKTYCNLNLDMISRVYDKSRIAMMARMFGEDIPKEALEKIDVKKFVSLSYHADTPELGTIIRENNNYVGLHLSMRASNEGMGGSDHAPFAMNNIPWAFFIAAMTEDYHQPTDSVEKASPELMEKIIRITYLTAFTLANN